MKLISPCTGPWEGIKVVYRIKHYGPVESYSREKRGVMHFIQLKPFKGTYNQCTEGLRHPSTKLGDEVLTCYRSTI